MLLNDIKITGNALLSFHNTKNDSKGKCAFLQKIKIVNCCCVLKRNQMSMNMLL